MFDQLSSVTEKDLVRHEEEEDEEEEEEERRRILIGVKEEILERPELKCRKKKGKQQVLLSSPRIFRQVTVRQLSGNGHFRQKCGALSQKKHSRELNSIFQRSPWLKAKKKNSNFGFVTFADDVRTLCMYVSK